MTNSTTYRFGGDDLVSIGQDKTAVIGGTFDIANVAATVTTGGYAEILAIPANTFFEILAMENVSAISIDSGSSNRVDLGDGDDDDLYVTNATTATAGYDYVMTGASTLSSTAKIFKLYSSAGSIRLKLTGDKLGGGTANATGKIRFVFRLTDCSALELATEKDYPNS